ncbi:MAG: T9SS type A sorting domain-containing protein [Bacteroidales bacterium]|nr:T9SS type A sorting domain-containing protein [Bacteroidales bacterium]
MIHIFILLNSGGAIRTENGKTYQLNGDEENLLMDFTLNVGDTLFSYISPGLVIGSIDSVLVGTEYRKRFNFTNGDICNWMIEGIGHEAGLFEPMSLILEFASEFHCYGESNIPLFGDMDCILNVGLENFSIQNNNVSIYPNPTSGKLIIDASELNNTLKSYFLTDIYGKMILQKNTDLIHNNVFEIDLSKYKTGIYFLPIQILKTKE